MLFNRPAPIPAAARIGIFAPSGIVDPIRLDAAVASLTALGHHVTIAPEATQQWRYFAGTDTERLTSFHRLLADPNIDLLMMARGGYGWTRLLPHIDWKLVTTSNKTLIGFSDFTAFSLAALAQSQLITYAGPGAATDFGSTHTDDIQADHAFMQSHLWPVLQGTAHRSSPIACPHPYTTQVISGPLWGSNLSLISHLVGTPYLPAITGGILFIEEIAEQPYAIERLCYQLYHAGILQQQRALLLGDFVACEPDAARPPYTMADVVETLRSLVPIPVLTGLPFGHIARKLTLPIGGAATLHIAPDGFELSY